MLRALLYSRSPMNTVMLRPIARRLLSDSRWQVLASGHPSNPDDTLETIYAPLQEDPSGAKPRHINPWMAAWRSFDLLLCPDIVMPARRARHRVEIFHGISFKGKAYTEKIRKFNHVFLVGDYMRRTFEKKGILAPDDASAHRIGMPKTDRLVDGSLDRKLLLNGMGLDNEKHTVLYAPTWRKESSLNKEGEAIIDALAGMGFNVLVKIHDHSRDPRVNRRDWGAWLDRREGGAVRRIRDADVIPALHAADLLVSDASSVANEYTLLDRPIIFMDVPELLNVYASTADMDTWGRSMGEVVGDAPALPRAVERALSDPSAKSEIRRAAARDLFYNPGAATGAALQAIGAMVGIAF